MNDPFARGARLFDAGRFFEAHEAWEERWRVATDRAERDLLQGLIQVAAAFHKLVEMKPDGTSPAPPGRGQNLGSTSPAPPGRGQNLGSTSPAPPGRGQDREASASRLLAKGLAKLDACPAHVLGQGQNLIHLATFREGVRACASDLAAGHFVRAAIPAIGKN